MVLSFSAPKKLAEVKLGTFYINPSLSLKVDKNQNTIWLDLDTKKEHFQKKKIGPYNFPIQRVSKGTNQDFTIPGIPSSLLQKISQVFQQAEGISLYEKISFVLDPSKIPNSQFVEHITNIFGNLSEYERKNLQNFLEFLKSFPKDSINTLLHGLNYSLVAGDLPSSVLLQNRVETQKIIFKDHSISKRECLSFFDKIIMKDSVLNEVLTQTSVPEILKGKVPKRGGAILIDMGGTGKSMIKASLRDLWKRIGGSVKEKSTGDITSYVNAAPQLIQTWYRGGVMEGLEGAKEPEEDLVKAALDNKVPSLLIIDEAQDFVLEDKGIVQKRPIEGAHNALKRFIQEYEKGGVTGYVVTLLIANMREEDIHIPLIQGAERLKSIYIGPPREEDNWIKLCKIGLNRININDVDYEKVAKLIMYHNKKVGNFNGDFFVNEHLCISPRFFLGFCDDFPRLYSDSGLEKTRGDFFDEIHEEKEEKEVDFKNFLEIFIGKGLKEKLNRSNVDNKEEVIEEYYEVCGFRVNHSQKILSDHVHTTSFIQEYHNTIRTFQQLVSSFEAHSSNKVLSSVQRALIYLQENFEKYLELQEVRISKDEYNQRYRLFQKTGELIQKLLSGQEISEDMFKDLERLLVKISNGSLFR